MLLYAGTTLSLAVSAAHQDDFDIAAAFAAHTSPDIRLAAVKLLAAVARGCTLQGSSDPSTHGITQARVDAAFQRLCSVVTTDTVVAIRTEALSGLAELHHASTAVKAQALSRRGTVRLPQQKHQSSAAAGQTANAGTAAAADAALLDTATGAFVHGTEDDSARVRLATVAAILSLGTADQAFAGAASSLLSELVSDELLQVRLAALRGLLSWAAAHQQHRQQALDAQQQRQQQQSHCQSTAAQAQPQQQQQQWQQAGAQHMQHTGTPERMDLDPTDISQGTAAAAAASDGDTDEEEGQLVNESVERDLKQLNEGQPVMQQQQHIPPQQQEAVPWSRPQDSTQQHRHARQLETTPNGVADNADDSEEEEGQVLDDQNSKQLSKQQLSRQQQQHTGQQRHVRVAGGQSAAADGDTGISSNERAIGSKAGAATATQHDIAKQKAGRGAKVDLFPGGLDGFNAALNALRDCDAVVRDLALQLLLLLPPSSVAAVISLVQGLCACCERFPGQHEQSAIALVRVVGKQRAQLVYLAVSKLIKQLARVVQQKHAAAHATARGAGMTACASQSGQKDSGSSSNNNAVTATSTAAGAAQSANRQCKPHTAGSGSTREDVPMCLMLVSEVICAAAQVRPRLLPSVHYHLERQGLPHLAAVQPFVERLKRLGNVASVDGNDGIFMPASLHAL